MFIGSKCQLANLSCHSKAAGHDHDMLLWYSGFKINERFRYIISASQLYEIGAVQKSRTSVFLVHLIKQLGRVQSYVIMLCSIKLCISHTSFVPQNISWEVRTGQSIGIKLYSTYEEKGQKQNKN